MLEWILQRWIYGSEPPNWLWHFVPWRVIDWILRRLIYAGTFCTIIGRHNDYYWPGRRATIRDAHLVASVVARTGKNPA